MPNPACLPTSLSANLLSALAGCMGSIGAKVFNKTYLDLIETQVRADQVMVFSYGSEKPACYLSYNTHPEKNANKLAQSYLEDGYTRDPLRRQIDRLSGSDGSDVFSLQDLESAMSPLYKRQFFEAPGISDKLTILARRDGVCLGLNFYRFHDSGRFDRDADLEALLAVLGQLALLHYSDRQPQDMRSPLLSLSEREREICEGILRGKTADAIAWDLDVAPSTVVTYRKRAYAKLGINSKAALFALCGS